MKKLFEKLEKHKALKWGFYIAIIVVLYFIVKKIKYDQLVNYTMNRIKGDSNWYSQVKAGAASQSDTDIEANLKANAIYTINTLGPQTGQYFLPDGSVSSTKPWYV